MCVRFVDLLTFGGNVQQLADGVPLVVSVGAFEGEFELSPCGLVVFDRQAVHDCLRTVGSRESEPNANVPR